MSIENWVPMQVIGLTARLLLLPLLQPLQPLQVLPLLPLLQTAPPVLTNSR